MKKFFLLLCLAVMPYATTVAQTDTLPKTEEKTHKFKAKIGGRLLLEGGIYPGKRPSGLNHQVNITDVRLTGKFTYEDWFMRIDVGFGGNKVGLKDSFLQYSKNGNCFRIGHMIGPFGIDPAISTYDYLFNTSSNIHNLLYFGRHLGLSYTRTGQKYYVSAAAFVGDNLNFSQNTIQGFNSSVRAVYRPVNTCGRVLQIGVSGLYRMPDMDRGTGLRNLTISATGVTGLKSPDFQYLLIADARNQNDVAGEIYFSWDKWMVQAEYMAMFVNRKDAPVYTAHGGYIQAGYLITGKTFGYDDGEALPSNPMQPKSLQLVMRYNFSRLNDSKTELVGGNEQDISVGLNYQFNSHISSRLNYAYLMLDESPLKCNDIHQIQARIAFWF